MKRKLCGIYCIENISNNKKYIGLSRDIKRRWGEHKIELNHSSHANQYLQSAWNKYGENNFKFYILEECSENLLSEREIYYIGLYKSLSHENGYNLTIGGEDIYGGKKVVRLADEKVFNYVKDAALYEGVSLITMIDWCKNKRKYMYYEEYIFLSPDEQSYWREYDWEEFYHKKLSEAHSKNNLSLESLKNYSKCTSGKNNPRATKVYCPQLDEVFDYMKLATEKYGINSGSIGQCIKGKLKSAGIHPITGEKLSWTII